MKKITPPCEESEVLNEFYKNNTGKVDVAGLKVYNRKRQPRHLIYQIFYKEEQVPSLDRSFVPYFNFPNDTIFREYKVMYDNYNPDNYDASKLVGFFSWKFGQKTGISGKKFLRFIDENPGYDVYFINPFPQHAFLFYNAWYNGECFHEGLIDAAREVLREAGLKIDIESMRNNLNNLCYCNFWVGNKSFWGKYLALTEPCYNIIRSSPKFRQKFLEGNAEKNSSIPIPLFSYFMERMFSTLLALDSTIKACPYYRPNEYPAHEKDILTKLLVRLLMPIADSLNNQPAPQLKEIEMLNSVGRHIVDRNMNKLRHDNEYEFMTYPFGIEVKNLLFGHNSIVKRQIIERVNEFNCQAKKLSETYIFGTGSCAEVVTEHLDSELFIIKGYFDNDKTRIGNIVNGARVFTPIYIPGADIKVIIASTLKKYVKEMYTQLQNIGYHKRQIMRING